MIARPTLVDPNPELNHMQAIIYSLTGSNVVSPQVGTPEPTVNRSLSQSQSESEVVLPQVMPISQPAIDLSWSLSQAEIALQQVQPAVDLSWYSTMVAVCCTDFASVPVVPTSKVSPHFVSHDDWSRRMDAARQWVKQRRARKQQQREVSHESSSTGTSEGFFGRIKGWACVAW